MLADENLRSRARKSIIRTNTFVVTRSEAVAGALKLSGKPWRRLCVDRERRDHSRRSRHVAPRLLQNPAADFSNGQRGDEQILVALARHPFETASGKSFHVRVRSAASTAPFVLRI